MITAAAQVIVKEIIADGIELTLIEVVVIEMIVSNVVFVAIVQG